MGVMCSLLGHDYGDPGVERERIEDGDEVVVTAKRVERCQSCGRERTISENTEVTALSAAAGVVREPDGTVVVAPDGSDGEVDDGNAPDPMATAAETPENSPSGTAAEPTAQDDGPATESDGSGNGVIAESLTATSALGRSTDGSGRTDDRSADGAASIDRIGDEPTSRDPPQRAPGEWPAEPDRPAAATTVAGESGASAASAGQWPGDGDSGEAVEARTNGRKNGNDGPNGGPERPTGGSFVCASCGFDAAVIDSPHRAGDICPNCHRGYLAWETRKG